MHEFISHPGLQFYIFRLSGTLTYTLTATGKPPRDFELHDVDFEDAEGLVQDEESLTIHGTDGSAVGLVFKLVKNVGTLDMKFEGRDGGSATWKFEGLEELSRDGQMYATAGVQTSAAETMDSSMQTMATNHTSSAMQTEFAHVVNHITQTDSDAKIDVSILVVDASTETDISVPFEARLQHGLKGHVLYNSMLGIKRGPPSILEVNQSKKQKLTEDSTIPKLRNNSNNKRYLFLWGYKREPRLSANYGALRIDTVTKEARWQERSGNYPWRWEVWECNIDLREPKIKIRIVNIPEGERYKKCTKSLQLTYRSGLITSKRFSVQFLDPPDLYESDDPDGADKATSVGMKQIIGGIKKCIEYQSSIPMTFWHTGGTGIPMEPGSILKANK